MKFIYDTDTESVIDELHEGDRIRRKNQDDYFKEDLDLIEINVGKDFVKMFNDTMSMLGEEDMSLSEYKICFTMLRYIGYESGILRYENNGRPLNLTDIERITRLSKSSVIRGMKGLVSRKIFGIHKTGKENVYTVNPFIFMKGKKINKTLYQLFKKSKWAKK